MDGKRSQSSLKSSATSEIKARDERLEELLGWYLMMNGKTHHGFII